MSTETTNEHKSSLDEIKVGDTIITITGTNYGPSYSKRVVTKVTRTQIAICQSTISGTSYQTAYRRKDGQRVGDKDGRTTAYAPNQVVNAWSKDKETALQLMEANEAEHAAKVKRNDDIRYIEQNLRNVSSELLAQMVAMMTEEKAKKDAEFAAGKSNPITTRLPMQSTGRFRSSALGIAKSR